MDLGGDASGIMHAPFFAPNRQAAKTAKLKGGLG